LDATKILPLTSLIGKEKRVNQMEMDPRNTNCTIFKFSNVQIFLLHYPFK